MPKNNFSQVIASANSGKRFPVMKLVNDDPSMAAVISKLIRGTEKPMYDDGGNRTTLPPNVGAFKEASDHTAQSVMDAETVMQILPDMELAAQIRVSSILSPKDMMSTELTFSVTEGLLAPDVTAAMLARTTLYFEQDYKIKPLLSKMLRDMLFATGSYAVAVIPENSIDEVINGSKRITMESLRETINADGSVKSIGLLGPVIKNSPTVTRSAPGLSLEAFDNYDTKTNVDGKVTFESILSKPVDSFLTVTDNHNLLKIPKINQRIREQRIVSAIGSKAMESMHTKMNDRELSGLLYKEKNFNYKPITVLKTQEQLNRNTVGNPLILHLPSESVIPVYVPGCVEEQIGFFVLIDADGNPISKAANADYYREMGARLNTNGSFPTAMLNKVSSQMNGFDVANRDHLDYSAKVYGEMIEQDLSARLRNGVYGNGVALAKTEEVYRIMLARALAKQHTQLLFIPIELMTYFAFKYNANGIGESVLEKMKILNSLRAMMLFANVMASLKNSIGRTEVKIKLDESDPNPQKTIEIAQHEIIRTRQQSFPIGLSNPTDITDFLQRSGFEFTYEGHPGLPDVAVDFGEKSSTYVKPDTELEDSLRKRAIMAAGLSPETVDASANPEFAVSVVTNNLLLSKRVLQDQEQFEPQLGSHMRKCMMNSEELLNDLREILMSNFDKLKLELNEDDKKEVSAEKTEEGKKFIVGQYLTEFIMNFEVSLPKPNSITLENQLLALETYTKALDQTLEAWVSEKFFTTDIGGNVANQVATIKEVLKSYYIRQWMSENGVMTELGNLTATNSDGTPSVNVFAIQEAHMEALTKSLTSFMVKLQPVKEASDKQLEELTGGSATNDDSSTDTGDDQGSDDGGDGDGSDDLDLSDDLADDAPEPKDDTAAIPEDDTEEKTPAATPKVKKDDTEEEK